MSDFRFDPMGGFRWPSRSQRPRVIRGRPRFSRGRIFSLVVIAIVVALLAAGSSLLALRVQFLFLDNLGHANVFWTPIISQLVLFLIGLTVVTVLLALNLPGWLRAAHLLDASLGRGPMFIGIAGCIVAGVIGGIFLAAQWQDVLLWMNGHSFASTDPAFGKDFSFFLFTLPILDEVQAIAWGIVLVSLLVTAALAASALAIVSTPEGIPLPLQPDREGAQRALRVTVNHAVWLVVLIFVLAAAGAYTGAFHLATSQHDNFVGLDATQRAITRPVLGILQVAALIFAVATVVFALWRRRKSPTSTATGLGVLLAVWLVGAGLAQGVPAAIYQGTAVGPNAQTAQSPAIGDYLTTSRLAWALQTGTNVDRRQFSTPHAPTVQDLVADPGTLSNVRVQDYRQLPQTFTQIDRSRSYQSYPAITVDRYPAKGSGQQEVMLGAREIAENDIAPGFVSRALIYTHGYGLTAVSINQLGSEGKPLMLAGHMPLELTDPNAPPDLQVSDPRVYCGLATTQPVVVNTTQQEFDYPSGQADNFSRFGSGQGIANPGLFDRLALSLNTFGGFDFLLTNSLTPQSQVLLHRQISDRIQTVAPFLRLDSSPYLVADRSSGHLFYIVDAYVSTDRFPESFQIQNGTSYMRNSVKAIVDARTCQTTLYVVDPTEPLTAAYSAIYPGLFTPLSAMPPSLRAHLRYPQDLFQSQVNAYAAVHIQDPHVLFNRSDLWRPSEEYTDNNSNTGPSEPYYVELNLPSGSSAAKEAAPQFVLLQTFSPAASSGSGGASNVMTAWLAAECDYTSTAQPKLVSVPLDNSANVLGPLQFDNNINTDKTISSEITLLNQSGSQVVMGNVIILPFNNDSFLYIRPLYVQPSGGSFPQLKFVIVGTKDAVAQGTSFAEALQNLFGQPVPGISPSGSSTPPSPTPPGPASPLPSSSPSNSLSPTVQQLIDDLLHHQQLAQSAFQRGDFAAYGQEQTAIQHDADQLRQILGPGTTIPTSPLPSPKTSPSQ